MWYAATFPYVSIFAQSFLSHLLMQDTKPYASQPDILPAVSQLRDGHYRHHSILQFPSLPLMQDEKPPERNPDVLPTVSTCDSHQTPILYLCSILFLAFPSGHQATCTKASHPKPTFSRARHSCCKPVTL